VKSERVGADESIREFRSRYARARETHVPRGIGG
jgi:hypothetical protein